MDEPSSLDDAKRLIKDLREDGESDRQDRLEGARRRAEVHAGELLICAIDIAGLAWDGRDELALALDIVRSKAEEVGLMMRRPPKAVD